MTSRNDVFSHREPAFDFFLEKTQGLYFIHQDVRLWNKQTRESTQAIIDELGWLPLRVCVLTTDTKLMKYACLYGFKQTQSITSPDGVEYHILSRR